MSQTIFSKIKNYISEEALSEKELLLEFKSVYRDNEEQIRHLVYWLSFSDDVDDIVQDTFYKAWKNYSKFRKDSKVGTWLKRIAINTTYDYFRKNKKWEEFDESEFLNSQNQNLEYDDLIKQGLLKLNEKHRDVFVLYYQMEYNQKEISEILDIKLGTVKSRLFQAKGQFIEFANKNGLNDGGE